MVLFPLLFDFLHPSHPLPFKGVCTEPSIRAEETLVLKKCSEVNAAPFFATVAVCHRARHRPVVEAGVGVAEAGSQRGKCHLLATSCQPIRLPLWLLTTSN